MTFNHASAICEELLRRDVRIRWTAWLGFRRVEPDFLGLMQDAGCERVAFSADGLLNPSLERMRKEMSFAEIRNSVESVRLAADGASAVVHDSMGVDHSIAVFPDSVPMLLYRFQQAQRAAASRDRIPAASTAETRVPHESPFLRCSVMSGCTRSTRPSQARWPCSAITHA